MKDRWHLHHQSASELQQFFLDVMRDPTNREEEQEYRHPLERSVLNKKKKERNFGSVGHSVNAFST